MREFSLVSFGSKEMWSSYLAGAENTFCCVEKIVKPAGFLRAGFFDFISFTEFFYGWLVIICILIGIFGVKRIIGVMNGGQYY